MTDPLSDYLKQYGQYKEFLLFDVEKELKKTEDDESKEIK